MSELKATHALVKPVLVSQFSVHNRRWVKDALLFTYLYQAAGTLVTILLNHPQRSIHPTRRFPYSNYALQAMGLGNIQRVSSRNTSSQTRDQTVSDRCLNLVMGMPYGRLLGFSRRFLPERIPLVGSLPQSTAISVLS